MNHLLNLQIFAYLLNLGPNILAGRCNTKHIIQRPVQDGMLYANFPGVLSPI